ncbi:MAG: PAS domain-containing protein [Candidatus Omnitrophota bacterium]
MTKNDKTKEELLAEIAFLQKQVADFTQAGVEHKRGEEALRSSEEQLRALVDNINLGITYIDKDYNVVFTNKAQGELFRRSPAEFAGKHCFFEFEKRDRICPHCPGKIAMATGRKAEAQATGRRQDGSNFQARIEAFPFFLRDGKIAGFIEVVEDISERKKAENALEQKMEELESFKKIAVGRELKMIELKEKIRVLEEGKK